MRTLNTVVLILLSTVSLGSPTAGGQTVTIELPGLEGAYGGFAGATLETSYDFGQSFPGVAEAWLDVTGYVGLGFPVDVGFQIKLDGLFGPVQFATGVTTFVESVAIEPRDTVLDGHGAIGLGAFVQFCCDHQAFVTSATLRVEIESFESVVLAPTSVAWEPMPYTESYDVVTGDLAALLASGGDFDPATSHCLAANGTSTSEAFDEMPEPGSGIWTLVRAGDGSYDSGAPSQAGSRDMEIRLSESGCP